MRARGILGFALVSLAACAGRQSERAPAPGTAAPPTLHRLVAPFPVVDRGGETYAEPFLGGFNIPRPQLADIDGDGDLDLFIQEASDRLMFFENVGDARQPVFRLRADRFQDLAIGEWYRLVDLDGDGDLDLLAEAPFSYIRYYRNVGDRSSAVFELAADTLRDDGGEPIFSDRQNIPTVADLDCNGRLDLFLGRLNGTITRYEAVAAGDPVPRFRFVTDRFEEIEIISQYGTLHGANTMAIGDIDGDGDPDLLWGDFFEPGLLLIENTGSCERPALRGTPVPFPPGEPLRTTGYNAATLGDLDGDGDLDLLVGVVGGAYNALRSTRDNLYYLEQRTAGRFVHRTARFLPTLDVGSESIVALADWDADGDLDLFVANQIDPEDLTTSIVYRFENRGTAAAPVFHAVAPLPVRGAYHFAPAFGDLDGDGDLDMLLGSWHAAVAYYENRGGRRDPRWELADTAIVRITRGSNTTPALVDVDRDGDLDLFVGEASGTLNYYRNVGSTRTPIFELVSDTYGGIDVGRRSAPAVGDIDADGIPELVVGADDGTLHVFRLTGDPALPFAPWTVRRVDGIALATAALGDLDGDGHAELLVGNARGGVYFFRLRHGGR